MKKYHRTKDGRKLLISEMTDDHLLNTICLLHRKVISICEASNNFSQDYHEGLVKHFNLESYTDEYSKRNSEIKEDEVSVEINPIDVTNSLKKKINENDKLLNSYSYEQAN